MKQRIFEPNYKSRLGLKQSHAITAMPYGSLLDVKNMNLDGRGGKAKRNGYTKLFNLPINDEVYSLIDFRKSDGSSEVVSYSGTAIYSWDGAAVSSVITGLTPNEEFRFAQYQDRLLGVNGVDNNFSYDGTNYTEIGIDAPTGHLTATLVLASGSLTDGNYEYLATFYDSARGAESNPFSLTGATVVTTAAPNSAIALTNLPTVAAGQTATHHRIYRKDPGGTTFYRTAEIPYVAAGTYNDTGDTSGTIEIISDTGQIDTGNTPPPDSKLIIEYYERIFMVDENDPTLLVYSRPAAPHAFPSGNYHIIADKDGGRIIKLEKHKDTLIIHKENAVYILNGNASTAIPQRVSRRGTHNFGTSVSDVDNYIIRLTGDGIYLMNPTQYDNSDLRDYYIGRDIATEETTINWGNTDNVKMWNYTKGKSQHVYMMFPNPLNYTTKVLVFDYSLSSSEAFGEWVKYEISTDIFSVAEYEKDGEKTMMFGDGYGHVWLWDDGDADGYDLDSVELNGTATSSTANTISDSTQAWTVNELVGATVYIRDGFGIGQRRRIILNTATQIIVNAAWTINPDTTSQYSIGNIDAYAEEFWNSNDHQNRWKRMRWIVPYVKRTGDYEIVVAFRKDFSSGISDEKILNLSTSSSTWGTMLWGSGLWGALTSNLNRIRFSGKYHYYSIKYSNNYAGQPFFWDGHGATFQLLTDRNK